MIALLDPATMDGQSPPAADPSFGCETCGAPSALRYVVLPRSELNLVTGAPFNRALVDRAGDRLVVRTIEVPSETGQAAEALYEFSSALEPLGASYGGRYWELHRALEASGQINHTRDRCPDRDGPRRIEIWEPATGWTERPPR
jgi:hypothetical protein